MTYECSFWAVQAPTHCCLARNCHQGRNTLHLLASSEYQCHYHQWNPLSQDSCEISQQLSSFAFHLLSLKRQISTSYSISQLHFPDFHQHCKKATLITVLNLCKYFNLGSCDNGRGLTTGFWLCPGSLPSQIWSCGRPKGPGSRWLSWPLPQPCLSESIKTVAIYIEQPFLLCFFRKSAFLLTPVMEPCLSQQEVHVQSFPECLKLSSRPSEKIHVWPWQLKKNYKIRSKFESIWQYLHSFVSEMIFPLWDNVGFTKGRSAEYLWRRRSFSLAAVASLEFLIINALSMDGIRTKIVWICWGQVVFPEGPTKITSSYW